MSVVPISWPEKKQPDIKRARRKREPDVSIGRHRKSIRWKRWVFGVPTGLVLPFILLVRFSSWLYSEYLINAWLSVVLGCGMAMILLVAVSLLVARKIGMQPGKRSARTFFLLFASYTLYLLVFISAGNVKTPDIRETYSSLHPVLRVATSTFMLLDSEAVVTESQRKAADYQEMGLLSPRSSLHYVQHNGFVHAIDLRTKGRSELRNVLTAAYFRLMGFSTLRHNGTADHLHVSLRIPGKT